jgi:hypothetical protein
MIAVEGITMRFLGPELGKVTQRDKAESTVRRDIDGP